MAERPATGSDGLSIAVRTHEAPGEGSGPAPHRLTPALPPHGLGEPPAALSPVDTRSRDERGRQSGGRCGRSARATPLPLSHEVGEIGVGRGERVARQWECTGSMVSVVLRGSGGQHHATLQGSRPTHAQHRHLMRLSRLIWPRLRQCGPDSREVRVQSRGKRRDGRSVAASGLNDSGGEVGWRRPDHRRRSCPSRRRARVG